VRPTRDRVRESLFNILEQMGPFSRVADLFAGSGALGLEALSRWGGQAAFVEADSAVIAILEENIRRLKFAGEARVLRRDLSRGVGFLKDRGDPFDLMLLDPPYGQGWGPRLVPAVRQASLLSAGGILVFEHDPRDPVPPEEASWRILDQRRYGSTCLTFYRSEVKT
jgi:16S rRNA (guanine966-N2)-methyltransferase